MLSTPAKVFAWLTAVIQAGIAGVEMALWMSPFVYERLRFKAAEAEQVAPIVRNAGLCNAFLAAGLVWGLTAAVGDRTKILAFFLACVAIAGVAGVFGAFTLKTTSPFPTTLIIQALPAALGLAAIWRPVRPR